MATTSVARRSEATGAAAAIKQFRIDLQAMQAQFAMLMPRAMVPKFTRVIVTAVQNNLKLLACDKQSLFNSCMQAAQDGLLPDGREGQIIPYGQDEDGNTRGDVAKWIPMVGGLRKKVRNSGLLSDWNVQAVQEGDDFDFQLGDDPFIHHRPARTGGRTRKLIAVYSIARFKDGGISREVMNADQIDDIRKLSRAKRGPWSNPVFFVEMAKKTVARLHAKQLPQSTDLDQVLHRDDDLYDITAPDEGRRALPPPGSARAVLDQFAAGGESELIDQPPPRQPVQPEPPAHDDMPPHDDPPPHDDAPPAQPQAAGPPKTEADYVAFTDKIIQAAVDAKALNEWWNSPAQRRLRNTCGMVRETFDALVAKIKARSEALESA